MELFVEQFGKYGDSILSSVVLTSVAAAYCDIDNFEMAKKCCDRARAMSGSKTSEELHMVYQRLKQHGY